MTHELKCQHIAIINLSRFRKQVGRRIAKLHGPLRLSVIHLELPRDSPPWQTFSTGAFPCNSVTRSFSSMTCSIHEQYLASCITLTSLN